MKSLLLMVTWVVITCHPCIASTVLEAGAQITPCQTATTKSGSHDALKEKTEQKINKRSKRDMSYRYLKENLGNCKWRLAVMLTVTNNEKLEEDNYIKITWVRNPSTNDALILYQPILIKLSQSEVTLTYPIIHIKAVNNKAHEVVVSKDNNANFTGCDSSLSAQATCGLDTMNTMNTRQKIDPDSSGFCCQCDERPQNQPFHKRGGQNCSVDLLKYEEYGVRYSSSAHCFAYDTLWYSLNKLSKPYMQHRAIMKVYLERPDKYGVKRTTVWMDMSNGQHMEVGTDRVLTKGWGDQIRVGFKRSERSADYNPLDYMTDYLLIPEPDVKDTIQKSLQATSNTSEYLVVQDDMISWDGSECNKIGVSHTAFVAQNNRCEQPQQSCLSNQPYDLWLHDQEKKFYNAEGKFMLGYYGTLAEDSLSRNNKTLQRLLQFQFKEEHTSHFMLELVADNIMLLEAGVRAILSEVHIVSQLNQHQINVTVFNPGLVAGLYSAVLSDCSSDVTIMLAQSTISVLGPHQSGILQLKAQTREHPARVKGSVCKVTVLNAKVKNVASREIYFQENNRCFCLAQCKCKCMTENFTCELIGKTRYQLMGFSDEMPDLHREVFFPSEIKIAITIILIILFFLLFLGTCKACIGLVSSKVGCAGLCLIKTDPDSKRGEFTKSQEVSLNICFFFYMPFIPFHYLCIKYIDKDKHVEEEFIPLLPRRDLNELIKQEGMAEEELIPVVRKLVAENKQKILDDYRKVKYNLKDATETSEEEPGKNLVDCASIAELGSDVYLNVQGEAKSLKNSGSCYSLCGKLKKTDKGYRFAINIHKKQLLHNVGGQIVPLSQPVTIPVRKYSKTYSEEAQVLLSEEPLFPCLNKLFHS